MAEPPSRAGAAHESDATPAAGPERPVTVAGAPATRNGPVAIWPVTVKRLVRTEPTPGPPTLAPLTSKKLVPLGLPITACGVAPSPMKPAGGAEAAGSHVRNGLSGLVATTDAKSHGA